MGKAAPILNVADVAVSDYSVSDRVGGAAGRLGPSICSKDLGCTLWVVPPGKRAGPYHAHHGNEEVFVILEGNGSYRIGEDRHPIRAGDVIAAPAGGKETAHQISNTGKQDLRYLAISTMRDPDVVEYPDSDKFLVTSSLHANEETGLPGVMFVGRLSQGVQYWDGETE